jgi:tubulin polyglutamylase TTLL6/13
MDFCLTLRSRQFVNHFPGTFGISRKVELWRTYKRVRRLFPDLYTFHRLLFVLPTQLSDLQRRMRTSTLQKRTLIVKPDRGAQGRGIFLMMNPNDLVGYDDSAIAQQYVAPLLLGGLKFDFQIYALLTSIDPLRIFIDSQKYIVR